MAHKVIIIAQTADHEGLTSKFVEGVSTSTYRVEIPVPHDCTPEQVGKLVAEKLRHLDQV